MQVVQVSGRFVTEERIPIEGEISFVPNMFYVQTDEGEVTPRAVVTTLRAGEFDVELSRTDQAEIPWHYIVTCPVGRWSIKISGDGPFLLKDLMLKKSA